MTSVELSEWMAFEQAYGLPDLYFLTAKVCMTLEGLWSEKPRDVEKIVPYFGEGRQGQTVQDMAARFAAIAQRGKT